jgi:hypothetical protein
MTQGCPDHRHPSSPQVLALDGSGGWSVHPGLRAKEASGKSTGSKVHTSVSAADLEEGLNGKQVGPFSHIIVMEYYDM